MTEVTVEGVTYRRGEQLKAIPLEGQFICATLFEPLFRWVGSELQFWCVDHWHRNQNPLETFCKGGIYGAIVVETQPEWVEVLNRYLRVIDARGLVSDALVKLQEDIAEILKAQRIRIHNVDGSVTEYWLEWHVGSQSNKYFVETTERSAVLMELDEMQDTIQLAFMRGSKVEVLR